MLPMPSNWHATLLRLAQKFLSRAEKYHVSTAVVYARDTEQGRQALDGPPPENVLRQCTGFGKNVLPPVRVRIPAIKYPLRAIYFGGDAAAAEPFGELVNEVSDLLDDRRVRKLIPEPAILSPVSLDDFPKHNMCVVSWILLLHELGLRQDTATGLSFLRLSWDEHSWVCLDDHEPGEVPSDFHFTFSHNSFADSAAAIDVLLSLPPRDGWVTVQDAAKILGRDEGNVRKLADQKKIRARGEGKQRRLSPRSIIEYIIYRLQKAKKAAEDASQETKKTDQQADKRLQQLQAVKHCPSCKERLARVGPKGSLYECERCHRRFTITHAA